ncbi:MAG: DUF2130 domain-containing protein [Nitrospira sp.]|nr:DUF2130 domain-containing protein [Nitrospira sp.]
MCLSPHTIERKALARCQVKQRPQFSQYRTGPRFRHRIEAIVEKFTDMQADLERERMTMTRLWAKREEQIRGVIESTAGMYGDLQGIAGKSLQEIEGLELTALEPKNPIQQLLPE